MTPETKLFAILGWISTIFVVGVCLFTQGFLLQRLVIKQNSICPTDFIHISDEHGLDGCWMHARFKKAVIIIIDALRYDFVKYNSSLPENNALPFQNKLPFIHDLMKESPQNGRLYKFIADPPTTTMQRILGMTTGSFPTFIDVGANFASSEIHEDNFVDQLVKNGKKITFMGDDTWLGLFPNRFRKQFPFPSFNVKDLHTVDNGVLTHLVPELNNHDWDVLIAHFLGVDHCGHRYGPYHPAMAEKLNQMDQMLRDVVKRLDGDTVLFVLGDHGMTRTGDHGGDSRDELDAALFIYSKSMLTNSPLLKEPALSQVDLVPTLSLLLGIPIPFSNLGVVIPEMFNHCPWKSKNSPIQQAYHTVKSLHLNAHQIKAYLESYRRRSAEFPTYQYQELSLLFSQVESDLQHLVTQLVQSGDERGMLIKLQSVQDRYVRYLSGAKEMCRNIWAKFDEKTILLGIMTVLIGICTMISLFSSGHDVEEQIPRHFYCSFGLVLLIGLIYVIRDSDPLFIVFGASFFGTGIVMVTMNKKRLMSELNISMLVSSVVSIDAFAIVCVFFSAIAVFSNSFLVYEDQTTAFLLLSLVFVVVASVVRNMLISGADSQKKTKSVAFDIGRYFTSPAFLTLSILFMFCLSLRLSAIFRICREEQWTCIPTSFSKSLSALADLDTSVKNMRYFMTAVATSLVPTIVYSLCRYNGNLNGFSPGVICLRYVVPLTTVCTCLHWALHAMPPKVLDSLPAWQQIGFARLVFVLCLISIITAVVKPLCIYLIERDNDSGYLNIGASRNNIVPKVYNHLKLRIRKHLESGNSRGEKPPMVYGLGTVYSTSQILLTIAFVQLFTILLTESLAPSAFLAVICQGLTLELFAVYTHWNSDAQGSVPWFMTVIWGYMSSQFFYNTGHQPTLPTLQWESAFVGFHGDHPSNIIPAVLMTINTFGSQIMFTVALPLVVFWPFVGGRFVFMFQKRDDDSQEKKGEFVLNEKPDVLRHTLFRVIVGYLLYHSIKLLASMCSAALLRRHLMVWKIFAPKFIFEGASFMVVNVTCVLVFLFVMRVDSVLTSWVEALCRKQKSS
ncbi:GPI ethanolamine phosphate transferase 3-like [Lineus longissimus]|uniref:GPI ethanolamine phosphate transferase 3-like n=1 Tax=Lineus longissimus TaxID=88925 RepID=UPI00315CFC0C